MGIATQSIRENETVEVERKSTKLQYAGILKKSSPAPAKKKIIKIIKSKNWIINFDRVSSVGKLQQFTVPLQRK